MEQVRSEIPLFLYAPWIQEHGDKLIRRIDGGDAYRFLAFDAFRSFDDPDLRRDAARFAREHPDMYRRMILRRLIPIRSRISAFVLTFDWAPIMRIIVGVCHELGIPTILIPHESVFLDRDKYYWDPTSNASVPVCDAILGWGRLQREIFGERGYDVGRFIAVGAPKFDIYTNYVPELSREQYHHVFGLVAERKTILFASQPLDSQTDARVARQSQRDAVLNLLEYCEKNDHQLIVRLPPSRDDILGREIREKIKLSLHASFDDAHCYIVSAEEALYHCDLVASVNSTMLFEGLLSGKPAVSVKYIEFEPFWENAGIPAARNSEELHETLDHLMSGNWVPDQEGMNWAADLFGIGTFDGLAAHRIREILGRFVSGEKGPMTDLLPSAQDRLFNKLPVDVVAISSAKKTIFESQRHLKYLVNARRLESSRNAPLNQLASVDVFLQWGITPNVNKRRQKLTSNDLGKPIVFIEDGFLRSVDIGLSGEPALSIILDDTTAYYDATKSSRLERLLQYGPDLSPDKLERSRNAIDSIVRNRVSKYNSAPDFVLDIGNKGTKKVLIVDQRYGDQSIESGLADESSFENAVARALEDHPDAEVLVKQHPDAIRGGKSSYFSDERLARLEHQDRIFPIKTDINPYALFDLVEEVYVVTSGMGFEALMAGKRVHCFGMPFYAGWGLTDDAITLETRRTHQRSLEEVFYYTYIESSRYFHPEKNSAVDVEEIIEYLAAARDRFLESKAAELALAVEPNLVGEVIENSEPVSG